MNPAFWLLPVLGPTFGAPTPAQPPRLCFSCPFDGKADADYAAGEPRALYREAHFVEGRRGQALYIGRDWAAAPFYASRGNLPKAAGAMELWVQVDWKPEGQVQRCFFHDDAPHEAGQNAIWLWQVSGDTLRLDVRDPQGAGITSKELGTWRPGEWHHLAATWRCDQGSALYMDGKLVAANECRWEPLESEWFNLGARPFGTGELEGAIDDFRLYDEALSPEQVARAYAGSLQVERAPKASPAAASPWPERAEVLEAGSEAPPALRLPKDRGAISLRLRPAWRAGDRRERVVFAEDGWRRPGGVHFRLVKPAGRAELCFELGDFRPTQLVAALGETWRTPAWHHVTLSWANGRGGQMWLDGLPAGRPYVVGYDEVQWSPTASSLPLRFGDEGEVARLRVYSRPLSRQEVWRAIARDAAPLVRLTPSALRPGEAAPSLTLYNPGTQLLSGRLSWRAPGGAGAQQLFLQPGRSIAIPTHLAPGKPGRGTLTWRWEGAVEQRGEIAYHVRPAAPPEAAGQRAEGLALRWTAPGEPKAPTWPEFEAAVDQALPATGDSAPLYVPWVAAGGPRYDSWVEPACGIGEDPACPPDFADYLLARATDRGRKVIVGVEATAFPSLQPEYLTPIAALSGGVANPCSVLFRGKVVRFPQAGRQPTLNALHPQVSGRIDALVGELLDRCAGSPAFAGIGFRLTPAFCGWLYDPQTSYDAYTLAEFARDTRVAAPTDVSDAWRTNAAYRWLRECAWEEWLTWRARRITAMHAALADRIAERKPGARLHIVIDAAALPDLPRDAGALRARLREGGLDLSALAASPNVALDFVGGR